MTHHAFLARWLRSVGLLSACLLAPPVALACSYTPAPVSLGSVSTQRVHTGDPIVGVGTFNFKCAASLLTVAGRPPGLGARFQDVTSGLVLKNGSHEIAYDLYQNSNNTAPVTGGLLMLTVDPLLLVGLLTGVGAEVKVYFATRPGPNIPAGTYTGNVNLIWTAANICEGAFVAVCLGTWTHGERTATMTITLTVTNDCTITAPLVDFGSAPLPGGFAPVSQSIRLLCSRDVAYSVSLSNGNYHTGGRRHMASGGDRLAYDIFKADQTVWGDTLGTRAPHPGLADGNTVQNIPYTARVYPDQSSRPAGTYTDNVVVDVNF